MSVRRQASSVVTGRECFLKADQAKARYAATGSLAARISDSAKVKSFAAASVRRVLETTTFCFSCMLANRSFHLKLYQAIHFDSVLHRPFFDERLDETRNNHAGCGFFG